MIGHRLLFLRIPELPAILPLPGFDQTIHQTSDFVASGRARETMIAQTEAIK
jgi:hypothetical protein